MQPARSPALRRVHPFKAYLEDVMAARRTGSRIIGIALASLLVSSTAGAQILFGGSAAGCYGLVCMPLTSFVTLPGTSVSPRWETFTGWTNPTEFAISQNQNARGDQDEKRHDRNGRRQCRQHRAAERVIDLLPHELVLS